MLFIECEIRKSHGGFLYLCLYSHSNLHSCLRDSAQCPIRLVHWGIECLSCSCCLLSCSSWVYFGVDNKQDQMYSSMQYTAMWWSLQWTTFSETLIQLLTVVFSVVKQISHPRSFSLCCWCRSYTCAETFQNIVGLYSCLYIWLSTLKVLATPFNPCYKTNEVIEMNSNDQ